MKATEWLTVEAAGKRLGKSPDAFRKFLQRQRAKGNVRAVKLRTYHVGGLNVYNPTDIDALVEPRSARGAA